MIPTISQRRRSSSWPLALFIGLCVAGLGALLWRYIPVKSVARQEFKKTESFITLQKKGSYEEMTRDQSMLLDSAPLFLPTRWSTAGVKNVEYSGAQTDLFEVFAPEITLNADKMKPATIVVPVEKVTADSIAGSATRLLGVSADAQSKLAIQQRSACYEIYAANGGKLIKKGIVEAGIPEADGFLWQPAEFWVRVVQEGLLGQPLLTNGSGRESLDAALRKIVASSRDVSLLPPGYYRVVVGP